MLNKLKPKSEFSRNVLTLMTGSTIVKFKKQGIISTAVHYPKPLPLQECFGYLGYKEGDFSIAEKVSQKIMNLPMNTYIGNEEIEYIGKFI